MRRRFIFFMLLCVAAPSLSSADYRLFIPRIYDYYGEVALDVRYSNDENKANGIKTSITDTFIVERLNVYTLGYVYHPNFITFRLNLSAGLKHEKFTSTFSENPWNTDPIDEYELRMWLLPQHPMNLELFTIRRTPLTRSLTDEGERPVTNTHGAILKYDRKPLFVSLAYTTQNTDTEDTTNDTDTYSANLHYVVGPFSNTAGYTHTEQHQNSFGSFDQTVTREFAFFDNTFEWEMLRLLSTITYNKNDQDTDSGGISLLTKSLFWNERLEIKLPWNFDAALNYRYYKDTTDQGSFGDTEVTTDEASMELNHQLYESLRSQYFLNYVKTTFDQGETKSLTNSLLFAYTKRIPKGILRAGTVLRMIEMENTGQATLTGEYHNVAASPPNNTFTLSVEGADEASIVVMVNTVVPPGELATLVELQRNLNYTVEPSGNTFLITILSVPPGICQTTECLADPFFIYSFRVSYSIPPQDYTLQTKEYGFNVRLELFKNLVNPYFSYYKTKQEVTSGTFAGIPQDINNMTIGLQLQKLPFIFMVEYQDYDSNVNPFTAWRSELDYYQTVSPTVGVTGRLRFSRTEYPFGVSGTTVGYTDTIYGANVQIRKTFFRPNMVIAFGASYVHEESLSTSDTYAINGGLTLRSGNTDIVLSGRASYSEAQTEQVKQELISEYFFLTLRRKIF